MKDPAVREQAKLWRARELGNLELLRATYLNHAFARHTHDEFMIGVIELGGCAFYYRGAIHVAAAGSLVFINPGEVHDGSGAEAASLTYRALYPEVALLQQAASELAGRPRGIPYFAAPVVEDEPLSGLVRSLHLLLEEPTSALERESRFLWTFAQVIGRHAEQRPAPVPLGKEHLAVRRVREYLEAHRTDQVTLAQLAGTTDLSPFHLLRVFRAALGLPPMPISRNCGLPAQKPCSPWGCLSRKWPLRPALWTRAISPGSSSALLA